MLTIMTEGRVKGGTHPIFGCRIELPLSCASMQGVKLISNGFRVNDKDRS
jgi:hypothetical protein